MPTYRNCHNRKKNIPHSPNLPIPPYLEVSGLGDEPVVEELLGLPGEAEEEFSVGLQLVDGLHRLMDLQHTA